MNRRVLFCLASLALLAALLTGCFASPEPAKPVPPAKEPDPNQSTSSLMSEIRVAPPAVEAGGLVTVSAGYYLGNNIPGGSHSLECAYPAQDGKDRLTDSWTETASDVVNVHTFLFKVDQPGRYTVTCQVDNQSVKSAEFQVIQNRSTDVQAEVQDIQIRRSSGTSRERFNVTVSYIYGSAAGGQITCAYPSVDGSAAQQTFPFTRPEPAEEYAGARSQVLFDLTVKKTGHFQVTCRADPGGREVAAGFDILELEEPAASAVPGRVIRAQLTETSTGGEHTITFTTTTALTYSPEDGLLTGTLAGEGTERWTGECSGGGKVLDHLILDYAHTYQAVISAPLAPGQEVTIPFQPSVHRATKIVQDYTVCGGGTSVTGPMEVDIYGSGTFTVLLAEDGSYRLSTHWDLFQYTGINGSVSGQSEEGQ